MRALEFGVEHALPVSIRSGGHGLPGFAVCDDGVMIDHFHSRHPPGS
jgi:FAD/FMN-containing dehydrogenase